MVRSARTSRFSPYANVAAAAAGAIAGRLAKKYRTPTATKNVTYKKKFTTKKASSFMGKFRKTIWRKPRVNKKAYKRRKKFYKKVMGVVNSNHDKAHFIVQRTLRMEAENGLVNYNQIAICNNGDLLEARRRCIFNDTASVVRPYDRNKLHVLNVAVDMYITNPTNVCLYMDVYEIKRRGLPSTSVVETPLEWLNFCLQHNNYDNVAQLNANVLYQGSGTIQPGGSPFQVPGFFQKFKIYKKTRHLLQPGHCETVQWRQTTDFTFDTKMLMDQAQQIGASFLPIGTDAVTGAIVGQSTRNLTRNVDQNNKKTKWFMYFIWGQPINDVADKNKITTSACALNIAYTIDYTVAQVVEKTQQGAAVNNIWVNAPFPTVSGQVVNADGSLIQPILEA